MTKANEEIIFLKNLEQIIGSKFLKSNKLNRKILKTDIFLDKDFRKYELNDQLKEILINLLIDFECNYNFSNGALYQYIDGLIFNHPRYGTRIIEFDEEQHFTPFRLYSLKKISNSIELPYKTEFIELCNNIEYFNEKVLTKHRINSKVRHIPIDLLIFRKYLKDFADENYIKKGKNINGYIKEKSEFDFIGGRIAQRAYFDTLREIAPYSLKNNNLKKTIRISKYRFEKIEGKPFSKITDKRIKEITFQEIERQIN
jgi:hypothetical protein